MNAPLKLAVFDCDGTLVDSQHRITAAMTVGFASRGHREPDPAAVRAVVGLSLVEAIARLLPEHDATECEATAEAYKAALFGFRERGEHEEPLYPGVRETLAELGDAGFVLGIATGKARRGLDMVLAQHGLADRFVTLQTADRSPGKPHPAMLLQAMDETGADPADTFMIGDTVFDVQMAVNARVRPIGVAWGYHPAGDFAAAGAEAVATQFGDLTALLRGR